LVAWALPEKERKRAAPTAASRMCLVKTIASVFDVEGTPPRVGRGVS
jgi:hypothetical protein